MNNFNYHLKELELRRKIRKILSEIDDTRQVQFIDPYSQKINDEIKDVFDNNIVKTASEDITIEEMFITLIKPKDSNRGYGIHKYGSNNKKVNEAAMVIVQFKYKSNRFVKGKSGGIPYKMLFEKNEFADGNITDEIRAVDMGQAFLSNANGIESLFRKFLPKSIKGIKYSRNIIVLGFLKSIYDFLMKAPLKYSMKGNVTKNDVFLTYNNKQKRIFNEQTIKESLLNSISIIANRSTNIKELSQDSKSSKADGSSDSKTGSSNKVDFSRSWANMSVDKAFEPSSTSPTGRALEGNDAGFKYRKYKTRDQPTQFLIVAWKNKSSDVHAAYFKEAGGNYKKISGSQLASIGDIDTGADNYEDN